MPGPRRSAVALAAALTVLAAGCGGDDGLPDDLGYEPAERAVVRIAESERGEPLQLSGTSAEGEEVDLAQLRGSVVVLNVWYATCPPCRREAPVLAKLSQEYADEGVRFVGVNVRNDSTEAVHAFQDQYDIAYPSIRDTDGRAQLALRGIVPTAPPNTLVLDAEGRVAAKAAGEVSEETLTALVDEVLAGGGAAG
ncbi:thiol-disulfide isomerase/thioredoxin [Kineococcus xinjiangensis]|uniref:Thiol-disulfide isomerase/thioredoxin n=1 Tax=Kineococcus xinjiangensis TaxID=512762 RepID=A0A2S6IH21_9ACTN|nr:TlpA disulfide reductase family protein [Kineococcus xinjiangensis]PPK93513.1 thiol-disulfide isomerase/thioredoxin [Kineococcus xinjiangensis]